MIQPGFFIDAMTVGMPPKDGGRLLILGSKLLNTNIKIENHYIKINVNFYAISLINYYVSEMPRYSLENVDIINIGIACCNGDEDVKAHEKCLLDNGFDTNFASKQEIKKRFIDIKGWYWELYDIERWISIDDIPDQDEDTILQVIKNDMVRD